MGKNVSMMSSSLIVVKQRCALLLQEVAGSWKDFQLSRPKYVQKWFIISITDKGKLF
jgi:hypothetical protein